MTVVRIEKTKNFTTMSNKHLRDENLSLKAKGLLSLMLSLPNNWDYSIVGLSKICVESINTINGIIHELEEHNYMQRKRIYEKGKIKDWEYTIYEDNDLHLKNEDIENQDIENLDIENCVQLNTNKTTNKEKLNTYIDDIEYIVGFLNEKADVHYKPTTKETQQKIIKLLKQGFDKRDFEQVITTMVTEWKGTEMEKYLRPETLFGNKFESYLNRKVAKKTVGKSGYTREELDEIDRRCGVYV